HRSGARAALQNAERRRKTGTVHRPKGDGGLRRWTTVKLSTRSYQAYRSPREGIAAKHENAQSCVAEPNWSSSESAGYFFLLHPLQLVDHPLDHAQTTLPERRLAGVKPERFQQLRV